MRKLFIPAFVAVCLLGVFNVAFAEARSEAPGWEVTATTFPTILRGGGGKGDIEVSIYNIGSRESQGPVTVTDTLPEGVIATKAGDRQTGEEEIGEDGLWECKINTSTVTCTSNVNLIPSLPIPQSSEFGQEEIGVIAHIVVAVKVITSELGTLVNRVTVSGGGAPVPASTQSPITIGSAPVPAPFGFQGLDGWAGNADGTSEGQAGAHPYDFSSILDLNSAHTNGEKGEIHPAGGQPRNISVNLPPGLVGNPTAVPECTRQQFDEQDCPPPTQVGIDTANAAALGSNTITPNHIAIPVYNLVPPPGVPAEFAFDLFGVQAFIKARVRSGGDSGITGSVRGIPQEYVSGNRITFWGEPADPAHDGERRSTFGLNGTCRSGCSSSGPRVPFFTLPTECSGQPQAYSATVSAWENASFDEASFLSHDNSFTPMGITGCDHLRFTPSISNAPDTSNTDTPAGLTVDVKVPQEGLVSPEGLAMSDIKDTKVVLPKGLVINPGQAAGLQACKPGNVPGGDDLPLPGENGEEERFDGPPDCPNASKVGTVQITTPLLKENLEGNVYVLQSNPPSLKLLAAASGEGVNIKLVLNVQLDEQSGQITTTVVNVPEAPVTDFKLAFSGGAQAALDTPTQCGEYPTSTDFTPWSTPAVADVSPSSSFTIGSGSGGSACPSSSLPFAPSLTAGSTTDQAGGFTNFSLLLQRPDDQQRISGLKFKTPPGLTGELSRVPLCSNEQAETETCPEASKIGHTVVESGPGPYPLVVPEPGQQPAPIYLTGPYNGRGACTVGEPECAPFGLAIVVPLHVGPFVLPTQKVRARIEVDPYTTQLTVTTNPLPQEVAGVPTDLRQINAVIEHPEFMINPTNCNPSSFTGTATGAPPSGASGDSATATISSRFQVLACQALKFEPKISVSTSAKTSKANGANLTTKVTYPNVPQGTDANIALAKVELPKQLPSRLTTLQKACTAIQFETNPAGCPPASFIGHAIVHTPLLPVPVAGPAIFVSHGGQAFPSLTMVLQGDGVTANLVGTTFISKAGITSTTFKTVPDVPFSTFELTLPQGKYSALTGIGNLCTQKLVLPNEFIGQNNAVLRHNTRITVTGCAKTRKKTGAEKLAAALKACHKDKNKTNREICAKQAHKRYGAAKTKKKHR